jgi:3-deoxy-D-manno-octulosonate 8-phosphate phosphatase (KDO 8-P phosphatase)
MSKNTSPDLSQIEMLVVDIDGVLTDGSVIINEDGSESKHFNSLDGHGMRLWKRSGGKIVFLSGRDSGPVVHRARQLDVDYVLQNCFDKLSELKKVLNDAGISGEKTAYIGDDLTDIAAMRHVGFSAAVANAVEEVKEHAHYVTIRAGGSGAAREVIEYILKASGKWPKLMERYLPAQSDPVK